MIRIELIGSRMGIYCVSRDWVVLGWFDNYKAATVFRDSLGE